MMELTQQQADALGAVHKWLANGAPGGVFRLGGYAGTGKTTIAGLLANERPVQFAAYTGKAVAVLRSKGYADASTLHRLLYMPAGRAMSSTAKKLLDNIRNTSNPSRRDDYARQLRKELGSLGFTTSSGSPLLALQESGGVLVVDEASMVDSNMARDLLAYRVPVIALGDPMQLPPINNDSGTLFTPEDMDVMLTDVQRQTGWLADAMLYVREYEKVPPELRRQPLKRLEADQIICYTNAKRWQTIEETRRQLQHHPKRPEAGDRIIVTMNNIEFDVYNGLQFEVTSVERASALTWDMHLLNPLTGATYRHEVWSEGFDGHAGETALAATDWTEQREAVCATYAHAITCHKAQGSEWGRVLVIEEPRIRDKARWLYTAVTRAREVCRVVKPA